MKEPSRQPDRVIHDAVPVVEPLDLTPFSPLVMAKRRSKCKGSYDEYHGEFDCEYGSYLDCSDCKYGLGFKDPEAKCNQSD